MKKNLVLLVLLLTSCQTNISSSNTSIPLSSTSTTSISSSLSSSSESSSSSVNEKEQLKRFYNNLLSLEGNVQKMNMEVVKTDYYATDIADEPLSISVKDISESIRYNYEDDQILVRKGKQSYSEGFLDFENYEMQIFYDDEKFYRITDFETSSDYLESIPFSFDTIDDNLNIGFPLTEKNNIDYMLQTLELEGYKIELNGINDFVNNGEWEYSYSFTIFEEGSTKIKSQQYTYSNKLFINNGVIEKVEQSYLAELYAGGYCLNWSESYSTFIFTQGERLNFTGEKFSISDYQ